MATRLKIYYPEREITNGLFTVGQEWMLLDTWEEYVGSYHRYESTGEVFTESSWNPNKSMRLTPYKNKPSAYFKYQELVNYTTVAGERKEYNSSMRLDMYTAPIPTLRYPLPSEIKNGVMTRYFIIKRNEISSRMPIEIDKKQADTYSIHGRGINDIIYHLVEVPWKLVGPEYDIKDGNILREYGVVDTNFRVVLELSKRFPILKEVLSDLRKYTQYDIMYSVRYRDMHSDTR